ncbi:MAG: hypothetical protein H7A55_01625 [Verrucomicrobiaceae bacterium]|nr:hypothetical protein [Verrucomicrobiaceae bacterium]
MSHAYTENQLVEQPAIGLFVDLGWDVMSAADETFGANPHPGPLPEGEGVSLGRMAKTEAVLTGRLRTALERLNPMLPPEAITSAIRGQAAHSAFRGGSSHE